MEDALQQRTEAFVRETLKALGNTSNQTTIDTVVARVLKVVRPVAEIRSNQMGSATVSGEAAKRPSCRTRNGAQESR
jgi:ribosomal protein S7